MVILSPQTSSSLENTKSEEDEHGGTVKIIESHTETEVSKISLMRSLVESQDPSAKVIFVPSNIFSTLIYRIMNEMNLVTNAFHMYLVYQGFGCLS